MSNTILIAYASRTGSAGGVAETIGKTLAESGAPVEVRLMKDVQDLAPYRAVVVGSAIRGGKWLPEAMQFMRTHRATLAQKPFAAFLVCITLACWTPTNIGEGGNMAEPGARAGKAGERGSLCRSAERARHLASSDPETPCAQTPAPGSWPPELRATERSTIRGRRPSGSTRPIAALQNWARQIPVRRAPD